MRMSVPRVRLEPTRSRWRLAGASLAGLTLAACSNGLAPPPLDAGGSSGTGSSSATSATSSRPAGDSGATCNPVASNAGPFSYTPKGCCYVVTPPSALGYTATALDDDSSAGPSGTAAPQRVRLGLGGDVTAGDVGYADPTTTAAFTWETGAANTAAKVQFGTSPSALKTVQTGYVWTLPATSTNNAIYMHEVHVCGLTPATTYYYQVGGGAPGAEIWSATQSFTTLPATATSPITLGIFGDARDVMTTWQLANEHIKAHNVDALVFSGDLTANVLGYDESTTVSWLDAIWQDPSHTGQFLTLGELLFLNVNGNHEYEGLLYPASGPTYPQAVSAFAVPGTGPYAKSFGSYNIGNAHFVYIEDNELANEQTGVDNPQADAQVAWLKTDLAAANADRTKHPFIFAVSHRGLYSTSMHSSDQDVLQARQMLAPIYAQYNVDAVFNGHDHEYERTVPITPGNPSNPPTPKAGGTIYVICAGAGANPYTPVGNAPSWRATQVLFGTAATGTNASYLGVYATLTLSENPSTAVFKAYAITPSGPDPVIDTFTITH